MHIDVDSGERPISHRQRSVLEEVLVSGPLSRAQLSRRLSLSAASLTKLTRPLLEADYFVEVDSDDVPGVGRPSQPIDLNSDFAHFIGFKLTGDSFYCVVTNARGVVLSHREEMLISQDVESVVGQLVAVILDLRTTDSRIAGVGVSLSGNASRNEPMVRMSPFLHWKSVPLATMIGQRVQLPTVLENDVRALTAAEQWFGDTAKMDSFAVLTLGAGIGCGIVANGKQIEGIHGASGLIGHFRINDSGPLCYAGHRGCAHSYATMGGISRSISSAHGSDALSFPDCVALFDAGDPAARVAFTEAGHAVGTLISTIINMIGPEKILIAGEGVEIFELSEVTVRARVKELLHWTASEIPIVSQPFGFSEWARGAAVVAIQEHIRQLADSPSKPSSLAYNAVPAIS